MKIADYKLLNKEKHKEVFSKIVTDFNDSSASYPAEKTIHQLFTETAAQYPNYTALVDGNITITYAELEERSNRIANFLIDKNLKTEEPVAVLVSPSINMISSILGVLKAGGAYTSINTDLPFERAKYILNDTGAQIILSEKKFIKILNKLQWECAKVHTYICLDDDNVYEAEEPLSELMKKELWDYVGEESVDDISGGGWVNSYSGEKLSREIMDEYGDNILCKLKPLLNNNLKVLEIGCSSGISMFRLAPLVKEYVGTDLSEEILRKTDTERKKRGIENIKLQCLPAHSIHTLADKDFDVIILNSVIQCFNGHNYLRDVLVKAIGLLKNDGFIFLGDIMDQDTKQQLIQSLVDFKDEERTGLTTKIDWSNELFVSKSFFDDLLHDFDEIVSVQHSSKIHTIPNELTEFRYDTIINIDKGQAGEKVKQLKPRHKYQLGKNDLQRHPPNKIAPWGNSRNLAYIAYTSGSTGKSKGVLIEHRSVVRLVKNTNYVSVTPDARLTMTAPLSFDASTFEIWGALLNGASLYIVQKDDLLTPPAFEKILKENQITICWLTNSLVNNLVDISPAIFSSLQQLIMGGDVQSLPHVNKLLEANPNLLVLNVYGPTENTTFSTYFVINKLFNVPIPIGKPVANSQCYILKNGKESLPIGIEGELCVSGDGLARGYLHDEALTNEKFIAHPFLEGQKIYRTGDLARWLPDGNIEFLGRNDAQVKIRGFRVELREIENEIAKIPHVKEVLVQLKLDAGQEKFLCAYIVSTKKILTDDLRHHLSLALPDYMIPSHFILLEKFPLNINGKIDIKALPDPDNSELADSGNYKAPSNRIEEAVASIWKDVLGIKKLGVKENFFHIGGHSLKATQVTSRIERDLDVPVTLREIFTYPTIETISEVIQRKKKQKFFDIPCLPELEYYDLSHAQKRLWILHQFEEIQIAYNMPGAHVFSGSLNVEAFENAFQMLVQRHESLRTTFIEVDGLPKQKIHEASSYGFTIEYLDLRAREDREEQARLLANNETITPFDLKKGPLLRAKLLHLDDDRFVFLFTMHHIISDGWSMNILFEEMAALYDAYCTGRENPLNPLAVQYKDFTHWQNERIKKSSDEDYWLKKLSGDISLVPFAYDFPRKTYNSFKGGIERLLLSKKISEQLKQLSIEHNTTLSVIVFAIFNILLQQLTGKNDILIAMTHANRNNAHLEKLIGYFANLLVIRTDFSEDINFDELVEQVQQNVVEAFDHQNYPFDLLVEKLMPERYANFQPLINVAYTFQNQNDVNLSLDLDVNERQPTQSLHRFDISHFGFENNVTAKFDLLFLVDDRAEGILLSFEYNSDLFKADTIKKYLKYFNTIVNSISPITELV